MTVSRSSQKVIEENIEQQKNELIEETNKLILDCLNNILPKNLSPDNINDHRKQIDELIKLREILIKSYSDYIDEPDRYRDDRDQALITNTARYLFLLRTSTQSLERAPTKNEIDEVNQSPQAQINRIHDPALGLELFRTYRSMIEHEGTLLNQRINWFLVTQGFLFAAFATAISAEISFPILLFLLIISITGFGYSCLISNPISLSFLTVDTQKEEWISRSDPNSTSPLITDQVKNLLPIQVCFDSQQTDPDTSNSILNAYLPNDYWFRPRSSSYRTCIISIPRITAIIWSVLFFMMINLSRSSSSLSLTWLFNKSRYLTV